MHLVEHALRAMRAHACRYQALPEVTVPSAAVTDDDTAHWSDIAYMQELVAEIEAACKSTRGTIVDRGLAEYDVDVYLAPWPVDRAEVLLAEWRGRAA